MCYGSPRTLKQMRYSRDWGCNTSQQTPSKTQNANSGKQVTESDVFNYNIANISVQDSVIQPELIYRYCSQGQGHKGSKNKWIISMEKRCFACISPVSPSTEGGRAWIQPPNDLGKRVVGLPGWSRQRVSLLL